MSIFRGKDNELTLHAYLTTRTDPSLSSVPDVRFWLINGVKLKQYSASQTWEQCRPRELPKDWSEAVWFNGCVPKHAFNMWIAQLDRMPTRSRLSRWGVTNSSNCPVCLFGVETQDHILLNCGHSAEIWRKVLTRLRSSHGCFTEWNELLSWIKEPAVTTLQTLKKIVTQATLYHLWHQRNNIVHNHTLYPADTVFRIIDREVRNIILGRRGRRKFTSLLSIWLA